jgi:hypothetical protein
MFIDSTTGKRVNIYAPYTDADNNRYGDLTDPALRLILNVVEITDPTPPEGYVENEFYRTELDDSPYVVFTRKPQGIIDAEHNARILAQIDAKEVASKMNRTVREQMIEITIERAAAKNNVSLAQAEAALYAGNIAFRRFKDEDTKIAQLRAKLRG